MAQVQVYGSQKYAVRIKLDPYALASRSIGIDEISTVIGNYNVNTPLGTLSGPQTLATLQSDSQLTEAKQFMPLIVAYRNGQPVRLQELGNVKDSVENDKVAAWYVTPKTKDRSIILAIQRQPGTNTIQVADAIKALLPSFREKLPASVSLEVLRDSSLPIKESAHDVQFTPLPDPGSGGDGDLPVPAQSFGNRHSESNASRVIDRHLCRHVPSGLQHR